MRHFAQDNSGTTAVEYAIIASFIFLVIVTAVTAIGGKLVTIFGNVNGGF